MINNKNIYLIIMNTYPYTNLLLDKKQILKIFEKLKKEKIENKYNIQKSLNKINFILNWDKYEKISLITDYFTEECRVKCKFIGKKENPLEYFKKHKKEILEKSYIYSKSKLNKKFSLKKFRDTMYFSNTKYCNKFNVIIAYYIYQLFKPKTVLDSSAGWGDRMIGAIAYGCNYQGYDPSECLESKYKEIIKTLVQEKKQKNYSVIKKPFEDVIIKKKYDLAFTSPPFFDVETYENSNTQSLKKFPNKNKWIKDFLIVLVEKNIKSLKKGGYLVIYVPYYSLYINYMKNHKLIKYIGKITYKFDSEKKIRELDIWKKI